ncbi:MAG TPA: BrnA antitoxin family protein [Xanthobacteraceae bacterium]
MREAGLSRTRPDAPGIELDASFWKHAKSMPPLACKASVHLRIDRDVLDWFRDQGKGHLTRMNHVLRAYYEAHRARPKQAAARARQHRKTGPS